MIATKSAIGAAGVAALLAWAAAPGAAMAGPCTQQIATLAKALSHDASLGPTTTGALSGSAPGSIPKNAPTPKTPAAPTATPGKKAGGAAATKEVSAASAQIATSPQDVRLQQKGEPTVAEGGNPAAAEPMAKAKSELQKARRLDEANNSACKGAVKETQRLMKRG